MDAEVKVTSLTANNVDALREVLTEEQVTVTATTATFHVVDPIAVLGEAMAPLPTRGHPRASLHAVIRKLRAAMAPVAGE